MQSIRRFLLLSLLCALFTPAATAQYDTLNIPATVFFDTATNSVRAGVKLAVWFSPVAGNLQRLRPDVELASVPYAMTAGISETVADGAITADKLGRDAVTADKIKDGEVLPSKLAPHLAASLAIPSGMTLIPGGSVYDGEQWRGRC